MKKNILIISLILFSALFFTSCHECSTKETEHHDDDNAITLEEVTAAQNSWAEAIVAIGNAYTNNKDYTALASQVIDSLYGYDEGTVLFNPTKAAEVQFRLTKEGALSYFVGGNIEEDQGFALQPWSNVRFENAGMILDETQAISFGNYFFTDAGSGEEVKVEYTFGYFRDADGKLRINVHHSSLPYNPDK